MIDSQCRGSGGQLLSPPSTPSAENSKAIVEVGNTIVQLINPVSQVTNKHRSHALWGKRLRPPESWLRHCIRPNMQVCPVRVDDAGQHITHCIVKQLSCGCTSKFVYKCWNLQILFAIVLTTIFSIPLFTLQSFTVRFPGRKKLFTLLSCLLKTPSISAGKA